jgi:UDP-sulfoquinovose synthase
MEHILILGGDGYLGWPTAMYFSSRGYAVTVVDNNFRRNVGKEIDVTMLYEVPNLIERANIWYDKTGYEIKVVIGDLSLPKQMRSLFDGSLEYDWAINKDFTGIADTVIHFAEQPSAPYSMMNFTTSNLTLINNITVTNNLIYAVKDYAPKTHIIKLGTMGEYGTPNIDIEEGWLDITHKGRKDKFLYPRQASSIYHTSKIMDTDLLWFGVRTWDLKVTDLMQGPVYGIDTDESIVDERLRTFFNYDEIFGTILNRFIVQAVVGYPLTVYGSGGQTRGYLNIKDTLQCIFAATKKPAKQGELRIFNQIVETFSVIELAELTKEAGKLIGYDVEIKNIDNPRKEKENHYYNPTYQGLFNLGVKPNLLTDKIIGKIFKVALKYKKNIREEIIFRGVKW